jgi:hypothetical protein
MTSTLLMITREKKIRMDIAVNRGVLELDCDVSTAKTQGQKS